MTEDEDKRRRDLYDEHRRQAWQDIQSSTDSFDKNLLAVSTAALGFSVAFIKDIVHLPAAAWHFVLYASWLSFAACIVITVFSFRLSVAALNKHLEYLQHYYDKKDETFLRKKSVAGIVLNAFTWVAAAFFLAGIICTVVFCMRNLGWKETTLSKEKIILAKDARAPIAITPVQQSLEKGRAPIAVTPISGAEERGRQPLSITPVQPAQPVTPQTGNSGTSGETSNAGSSGNSTGKKD